MKAIMTIDLKKYQGKKNRILRKQYKNYSVNCLPKEKRNTKLLLFDQTINFQV